MAGDGTSRINTEELLRAVAGDHFYQKSPLQRIQMRAYAHLSQTAGLLCRRERR